MQKYLLTAVFGFLVTFGFGQSVTFSGDIASIIYGNCTSCHRPGAIAPFSLQSYEEVYNNRFAILNDVQKKIMPPWSPNPGYSNFANENRLSQDQINKISAWVSGGCERGEVAKEPAVPVFNDKSQLPSIDFNGKCKVHKVTKSDDDFEFFAIPSGLSINAYIKQIELVPANRKIVHHIFVFIDSTGEFANFVGDGTTHINGNNYISGGNMDMLKLIGGWLPGGSYSTVPDNLGIHVPKNSFYIVQIHYAPGSEGQSDQTQLNIKYSRTNTLRNMTVKPLLDNVTNMTDGPINIAPNTIKTYHEVFEVPEDISLVSVTPHMHKVGTRLKVYAYRPQTGDTIRIIDDKWDFHWQGMYKFPKMVHLMANEIIYAEGTYDNTMNNPSNPNNPPQAMVAGTSTLTEMMQVFFSYVPYHKGDENTSLETYTLPSPDPSKEVLCSLFPNPVNANTEVHFSVSPKALYDVSIYSIDGRKILTNYNQNSNKDINLILPELPKGLYLVKISNDLNSITRKLQVE